MKVTLHNVKTGLELKFIVQEIRRTMSLDIELEWLSGKSDTFEHSEWMILNVKAVQ